MHGTAAPVFSLTHSLLHSRLPADKRGNVGLWHVNEGSYELPAAARRAAPILRLPAVEEDGQEEAEEQEAEGSRHAKPGEGCCKTAGRLR
jgi:hypothetical protein